MQTAKYTVLEGFGIGEQVPGLFCWQVRLGTSTEQNFLCKDPKVSESTTEEQSEGLLEEVVSKREGLHVGRKA